MEIFRKMSFADSTGDAIPFYHDGVYHIFSLTPPAGTTVYPERLRTTWSHAVSKDLIHWEELPTAIYPGEGKEPDASGVWTGSVLYGEGKYHAFYTGYNIQAEYQQTICHAYSEDGINWKKDTGNPVIKPLIDLYEQQDFRDPYVFFNEEEKKYWMLVSARKLDMPVTRRGCIVLYRSTDLESWEYYGNLYSPGHTNCPECSEIYKMNDTWILSYSRFSEFGNTIYRTAKSPYGPWKKMKKDGIGGRRFYAAKSLTDKNGRRIYFAWAHDRGQCSDKGEWYWGGRFCIPHEVKLSETGDLLVDIPQEFTESIHKTIPWNYLPVLGEYKRYGAESIVLDALETTGYGFLMHDKKRFYFHASIIPKEVNDSFGILLKSDKEASECLFLEFDVAMQRVSLLSLPMGVDPFWEQSCQAVPEASSPGPDGFRVSEKTFSIKTGAVIDVKIFVDHDMIEVFIGKEIAFTYRVYRSSEYEIGIIAQDSKVEYANIALCDYT